MANEARCVLAMLLELAEDELVAVGHLVEEELAELPLVVEQLLEALVVERELVRDLLLVAEEPVLGDRHPLEVDHLAVDQVEQGRGDVVAAHAAHAPDEGDQRRRQLRLREVAQVLRLELRSWARGRSGSTAR